EDAQRDARQWAASSGEEDLVAGETGSGGAVEGDDEAQSAYRSDDIGDATRLIDVVRNAAAANQITGDSKELSAMMQQLCRFQHAALGSTSELRARIAVESEGRTVTLPGGPFTGAEVPAQRLLKSIKSQQTSASREAEKTIQGIQGVTDRNATSRNAAVDGVLSGFGEQDVQLTAADPEESTPGTGPTAEVRFGPSTSFLAAGRKLADLFTLNKKQSVAFLLICQQLDLMLRGERAAGPATPQLCQFVGGEGGTGKS
ncbi:hypothetical protein B0J13DRAFT_408568, partial [Dactylonectria estremocensis]